MNRDDERELRCLLERELGPQERKLRSRLVAKTLRRFRHRPIVSIGSDGGAVPGEQALPWSLHVHLRGLIDDAQRRLEWMRRRESEFDIALGRAAGDVARHRLVLELAKDLGATKAGLRGDARALSRWFGVDAVKDRFVRRLNALERDLSFYVERFGVLSAFLLSNASDTRVARDAWSRMAVEETVKGLLAYEGDPRVACAAFGCLSRALRELPSLSQENLVEESTLQFIYRSAMQTRQDMWIQREALGLLECLSLPSLVLVLEKRLGQPGDGSDLFLRRRAVELLARNVQRDPRLEALVEIALRDPSAHVRQGLVEALATSPSPRTGEWMRRLALLDDEPRVRAAAILRSVRLLERDDLALRREALSILASALEGESDAFALRVATEAAVEGVFYLRETESPFLSTWVANALSGLDRMHTGASTLATRRRAAAARERIWCLVTPEARDLGARLVGPIDGVRSGESTSVRSRILLPHDDEILGRVLAVRGQNDFGFDVRRGSWRTRITRGHRFGFRLWRFLHEMRHPSPDKRQAHSHTTGRVLRGGVRAPSMILCELAETKVPGEPLYVPEEDGWRPYLPLVDDVLGVLEHSGGGGPARFFTAEGVTEVTPPRSLGQRARSYLKLTLAFPRYAGLRNWRGEDDGPPGAYVQALRDLGFEVHLRPHRDGGGERALDPSVARFFPAGLPFWDSDLWSQMQSYFVSVYENTLFELGLFGVGVAGIFCGRHMISNRSLRRARDSIPLVVGGWGTRGKSGTERIKAALFSALGYGFVSKTTGCEAMFLFANAYGRTKEMFLFRPYDKATIWEQRDVVRLASSLGTEVFLWECMGLTPEYVKILQRQWMRDDISTITNTYPDHEDLQGPAGFDIPKVMCNFIPEDSHLITSEEQMLPILAEGAKDACSAFTSVGWLESGMLTRDVLERFPYEEHPNNIALVLELARELGIDRDFALKEMADRVVPDIGVLKTYPAAEIRSRRLEFTNGMSANERHGCLGNWTRLGFDRSTPIAEPGTWICTVVNNRADRIARSRVFADIIARDIESDRHLLIGDNLKGLQGYIQEAWESHVGHLSLRRAREDGDLEDPVVVFQGYVRKLRLPVDEEELEARARAALEGLRAPLDVARLTKLWRDLPALRSALVDAGLAGVLEDLLGYLEHLVTTFEACQALVTKIRSVGAAPERLDGEMREILTRAFQWKIVVVEDYFAIGDEVIEEAVRATPPGMRCRLMGLQNIKGTGLDFVYRWQAWETCHSACEKLVSPDLRAMDEGLTELAAFREYGVLCEEHVRRTLDIVRRSPAAQRESTQAALARIETTLTESMRELAARMRGSGAGRPRLWSRLLERACGYLEAFLDAGDAIRRRKVANLIYRDLVAERIGIERAALELQSLNKRQKGGWLYRKVQGLPGAVWRKSRLAGVLKRS